MICSKCLSSLKISLREEERLALYRLNDQMHLLEEHLSLVHHLKECPDISPELLKHIDSVDEVVESDHAEGLRGVASRNCTSHARIIQEHRIVLLPPVTLR